MVQSSMPSMFTIYVDIYTPPKEYLSSIYILVVTYILTYSLYISRNLYINRFPKHNNYCAFV